MAGLCCFKYFTTACNDSSMLMMPILQDAITNFLVNGCSCSMICSVDNHCTLKNSLSFCTVNAEHTPKPYTPCCSKVLISASTPAPPLASNPAIESTYGRNGCIIRVKLIYLG